MSEYVFILGAGASREAGGPLMSDFFDKADQVLAASGKDDRAQWKPLDWARHIRSSLQKVLSKASLDIFNLEAVWGALELGRIIGRFPGLECHEIPTAIEQLKRCIAETLERSIGFNISSESTVLNPHETYANLVKVFGLIRTQLRKRTYAQRLRMAAAGTPCTPSGDPQNPVVKQ